MKKLNIKFILALAIVSAVVVVGVHFLHKYQVTRSAESLRDRAKAAEESGNREEMLRLLERYLAYAPDDLEQRKSYVIGKKKHFFEKLEAGATYSPTELGLVYQRMEKSIRDYPEDLDFRREAADMSIRVQRPQDAAEHLSFIMSKSAAQPKDIIMLARCHATNNQIMPPPNASAAERHRYAVPILAELTGFDPATQTFNPQVKSDEPEAYQLLAGIYREKFQASLDNTVADKIIEHMVQVNPNLASAHLTKARYIQTTVRDDEGREQSWPSLIKSLELDPDNIMALRIAIQTAMKLKRYEEGEKWAFHALDTHPNNGQVYQLIYELFLRQEKSELAEKYLNEGLAKLPKNPDLLWDRANLQLSKGNLEDCQKTIQRLKNSEFRQDSIEYLQARLLMAKQDFLEASRSLERLRPILANRPALQRQVLELLVVCYGRLGQPDRRLSIMKLLEPTKSLRSSDNNNSIQRQLVEVDSLSRLGRVDAAIKKMEEIQDEALAELTVEKRKGWFALLFDLKLLKIQRQPKEEQNWDELEQIANQLFSQPGFPPDEKQKAQLRMMIAKGDREEAYARAQDLVRNNPNHAGFYSLLLQLTDDYDQAMQLLQTMERRFGGNGAEIRLFRAERYVRKGGGDVAKKLADLEQNSDLLSESDQLKLWHGLGLNHSKHGTRKEARRLWQKVADVRPRDTAIRVSLLELNVDMNDKQGMLQALADLERVATQNSSQWKLGKAKTLIWQFEHEAKDNSLLVQARNHIENVRSQRPDWPPLFELEADVLRLQGDKEGQIKALQKALELQPTSNRYALKLSELLFAMGRHREAESVMGKVNTRHKSTDDLRREVQMIQRSDLAAALTKAEGFIKLESSPPGDLLILGRLQNANKKYQEAFETFSRMLTVAPGYPDGWLAITQLMVNLQRTDKAEEFVRRMQFNLPERELPRALGQCYEMMNDMERARHNYEMALVARPDDNENLRHVARMLILENRVEKATGHLRKILEDESPENEGNRLWARRTVARMKASRGSYQDFREALRLIQGNAKDGTMSSEDLSLWGNLAMFRSDSTSWNDAIRLFQQTADRRRLTEEEELTRAKLLFRANRWAECQRVMVDLLTRNPDNQAVREQYVVWLLSKDNINEAAKWANRLNPQSVTRLRVAARTLLAQNRSRDAYRMLQQVVPDTLPAEQIGVVRSVAEIAEELAADDPKFYAVAERFWRRFVKAKPDEGMRFVAFLARKPEAAGMKESLDIAEKLVQRDPKQILTAVQLGVSGLRRHKTLLRQSSPQTFQRVARLINAAGQAKASPHRVMMHAAEFADIQGDVQEVERIYREFLQRPNMPTIERAIVRNNLAYVLALADRGTDCINVVNEAIADLGPTSDLLDTRAMGYIAEKQYERAIADLQAALANGGDMPEKLFHLALAEHGNGNSEAATAAISRARSSGLNSEAMPKEEQAMYRRLLDDLGMEGPEETSQRDQSRLRGSNQVSQSG